MDKVKIKRVRHQKKEISGKEKILAGLGLGSTLLGGAGAVSAPKTQNTQFVRNQDSSSGETKTGKIKNLLKNIFGAKEAQAAYGSARLVNKTSGDSSTLKVGDSWELTITGDANRPVHVQGHDNHGSPFDADVGMTNQWGEYKTFGTMSAGDVGSWEENWSVGGSSVGSTNFTVVESAIPKYSGPWDVKIDNTTSGDRSTFKVGDSWRITVRGRPNAQVYVTGGKSGATDRTYMGETVDQDGVGIFTISGTMGAGEVGNWSESWSVGGVSVGLFNFTVVPNSPSYTGPKTATIKNLTSGNDSVFKVGETWQMTIKGPPGQDVYVSGNWPGKGPYRNFRGRTEDADHDGIGVLVLEGVFGEDTKGSWAETWYVGDANIGTVTFRVDSKQTQPGIQEVIATARTTSWDDLDEQEQKVFKAYFKDGQHKNDIPDTFTTTSAFAYALGWGPNETTPRFITGRTKGERYVRNDTLWAQNDPQNVVSQARINQIINTGDTLMWKSLSAEEKDAIVNYLHSHPDALKSQEFPTYKPGSVFAWAVGTGDSTTLNEEAKSLGFKWFDSDAGVFKKNDPPSELPKIEDVIKRARTLSWGALDEKEQKVFKAYFLGGQHIEDIPDSFKVSSAFEYALGWGDKTEPQVLNGKTYALVREESGVWWRVRGNTGEVTQERINQIISGANNLRWSSLTAAERNAVTDYLSSHREALKEQKFETFKPGSVFAWALGMGESTFLNAAARSQGFKWFDRDAGVFKKTNPPASLPNIQDVIEKAVRSPWDSLTDDEQTVFHDYFTDGQHLNDIPDGFKVGSAFEYALGWNGEDGAHTIPGKTNGDTYTPRRETSGVWWRVVRGASDYKGLKQVKLINTKTGEVNPAKLKVGDTWQININGAPDSDVFVLGGKKGATDKTKMGHTVDVNKDGVGFLRIQGTIQAGQEGEWEEQWFVGEDKVGQINFQVEAVATKETPLDAQGRLKPGWMDLGGGVYYRKAEGDHYYSNADGSVQADTLNEFNTVMKRKILGDFKANYFANPKSVSQYDGTEYKLNQTQYATFKTAQAVLDILEAQGIKGAKIVVAPTSTLFTTTTPMYQILMPKGTVMNAGIVAGYLQKDPMFALEIIRIEAARADNNKLGPNLRLATGNVRQDLYSNNSGYLPPVANPSGVIKLGQDLDKDHKGRVIYLTHATTEDKQGKSTGALIKPGFTITLGGQGLDVYNQFYLIVDGQAYTITNVTVTDNKITLVVPNSLPATTPDNTVVKLKLQSSQSGVVEGELDQAFVFQRAPAGTKLPTKEDKKEAATLTEEDDADEAEEEESDVEAEEEDENTEENQDREDEQTEEDEDQKEEEDNNDEDEEVRDTEEDEEDTETETDEEETDPNEGEREDEEQGQENENDNGQENAENEEEVDDGIRTEDVEDTQADEDHTATVRTQNNNNQTLNDNTNAENANQQAESERAQQVAELQTQVTELQSQIDELSGSLSSQSTTEDLRAANEEMVKLKSQVGELSQSLKRLGGGTVTTFDAGDTELAQGLKMPEGLRMPAGPLASQTNNLQMPSGYPVNAADANETLASKTYTVKKGDTLWGISKKVYGDGNKWRKILDANPNSLGRPGDTRTLKVGFALNIPGAGDVQANTPEPTQEAPEEEGPAESDIEAGDEVEE